MAKDVYDKHSNVSPYSKTVTLLLLLFLGGLGAHRFYVGKSGSAILLLFLNLCGLGGIWVIIDLIMLLTDSFTDYNNRTVSSWDGGEPVVASHVPASATDGQYPQQSQKVSTPPPPPKKQEDEMFCKTCGALVKKNETYCHYCGAILEG